MIIRRLKNALKRLLAEKGYHMTWTPPGEVTGTSLLRDLPLILPGKNPMCFDVGANTGQTIELLCTALDRPVIHAFEPAPAVYEQLVSTTHRQDVYLHHLALGAKPGAATLHLYDFSVLNSLLPLENQGSSPFTDVSSQGSVTVEVSSVDDFCQANGVNCIDLLKIDTQGYDLEVLRGSLRMLQQQRVRHVLIEMNHIPLYQGQDPPWEVEAFLVSHGFRLVDLYEQVRSDHALSWCTALYRQTAK